MLNKQQKPCVMIEVLPTDTALPTNTTQHYSPSDQFTLFPVQIKIYALHIIFGLSFLLHIILCECSLFIHHPKCISRIVMLPVAVALYNIFPSYFIDSTAFEKKLLDIIKCVYRIFLQTCVTNCLF